MAALFRMVLFVLFFEVLFYVLLSIYIRSLQREKLEDIWDDRHPEMSGNNPARREFVRKSMVGFERTLKARLVALVFVVPTLAVIGIVVWVNWQ